ncbi:MAG: LptE family protein [Bacteroidota bacterium]
MAWSKLRSTSGPLIIALLCQGFLKYSFLGTSLSTAVKTFSIQDFQPSVALGPADLAQQLTEKLSSELLHKTSLRQVATDGDIQFEGTVTGFKRAFIAPRNDEQAGTAGRIQLTITLQVSYSNAHDQEFAFSEKTFVQSADMDSTANAVAEEPKLVAEIVSRLIKDILDASVANW